MLAAPGGADGRLSAEEAAKIVDLLYRSQSETLTKLAALNDEQLGFKSGPDRWSPGQIAEHLYLLEIGLHSQLDSLMKAEPNPDWATLAKGKVQVLTQTLPDRTTRFQAPAGSGPCGQDEPCRNHRSLFAQQV